jgi:hypothetical protein
MTDSEYSFDTTDNAANPTSYDCTDRARNATALGSSISNAARNTLRLGTK